MIVEYILKNYDKVVFMIVVKFGILVGVLEFIVVRFVNELGFLGYLKF